MRTIFVNRTFGLAFLCLLALHSANAQGTITFDSPWINNGLGGFSLAYFDAYSFRVSPQPPQPHNDALHVGAVGPAGYPHNNSPYVAFVNTLAIPQSVVFALTNAATFGDHTFTSGAPFGLISVDLADPVAPSLTPVSITFNGFRPDGSMVSTTFTTPGNGAAGFQTFQFGPDFSSGLARVEIPSPFWAMDNIVFVPEPATWTLMLIGVGVLVYVRFRKHHSRR